MSIITGTERRRDRLSQTVLKVSRLDPVSTGSFDVQRRRRTFAAAGADADVWFGIIVGDPDPGSDAPSHGAGMNLNAAEVQDLYTFLGRWLEGDDEARPAISAQARRA